MDSSADAEIYVDPQIEETLREREDALKSFYENATVLMGVLETTATDLLAVFDNGALRHFFDTEPGAAAGRWASELGATPTEIIFWLRQCARAASRRQALRFAFYRQGR